MKGPTDPNVERIEAAVDLLGPLVDELVLVGGCVTGLLVTDPGAAPIRPTLDVDLVVDLLHYTEYHGFENRLRARGFEQRRGEDDPICRWWQGIVRIDVMPVGDFLGFTNPWYRSAIEHAVDHVLPNGSRIRHLDATHFIATKLAAFESRGECDPVTSHDAEDVVLVLDGRTDVADELRGADPKLRRFVARVLGDLLDDSYFVEALEGYFERAIAAERARRLLDVMADLRATL